MKNSRKNLLRAALCVVLCLSMLMQFGVMAIAADTNTAPDAPTGLLMDLMNQPYGIDSANPAMSWIVNDADNDEVQTAYQILVADSLANINADNGNVWDSGKVESNESSNALYAGPALAASSTYYWKVRTWDKAGEVSAYSEAQRFTTAVDTWTADAIWVGAPGEGGASDESVFERMGWKNYDLECKFGITSKALGFCFYMDNSEKNCYMWQVREDTDKVIPHVFENGTPKPQNSAEAADVTFDIPGGLEDNTEYTMKLSVRDTVVHMYVNGNFINTFDLEKNGYKVYGAGSFGFRTGGSEGGWIDDVKITNEAGVVTYQNDFSAETKEFGNASVADGRLVIPKNGRAYYQVTDNIYTNSGWYDYDLECDFGVTTKALGFSFYTDNKENNCYMWQIRGDRNVLVPHIFINGKASVDSQLTGDSDVTLVDKGVTVAQDGAAHKLKLSLRGTQVTTYIDGIEVDTREMGEYAYGSIGFRCGGSEDGWVDNVKVTNKYGTVVYENDFSANANGFSSGSVSDGKFIIAKDNKAYYAVEESGSAIAPTVAPRGNVMFARKDFTLAEGKTVDSAIVNVTALYSGFKTSGGVTTRQWVFRMYANGQYVGIGPHMDSSQGKGAGDYYYNTFDITDLLQEGENTIGAICYALQDRRFQAQLKVTYTDGTSDVYVTDNTWQTLDGTGAFGEGEASIGVGSYFTAMAENIDARLYPYGWNEPGFDASAWTAPVVKEQITNLIPTPTDPVLENEVTPASIVDKGNGNFFIDMGKEFVGGINLTLTGLEGVSGTDVTLMYGEELAGANSVKWQMRTGNKYKETITLKDGDQVFETFGMKNFRYMEITGAPACITKEVLENSLKGVAMYVAFDESESYFTSNDELLNDIYDFCKYSLKVTTQDLYVDSQSRERGPYEGDAYVNQLSHYAFAREYTIARFTNEFMAYHPEWCTEYQQENAMSFYQDYLYTGNDESVAAFYDKIKTKVLSNKYDETVQMIKSNTGNDLVDWPAGERDGYTVGTANPYNTVINAFNYRAASDVAEIAKILGNAEDAAYYTQLAADLKEGINALYNAETGNMMEGRNADGSIRTAEPQHANFFPVSLGAVTDQDKIDTIVESLAADGIKCSVYATQFLFTAMYNTGNEQAALDMLLAKGTRSFYHLIKELNATVASEGWDPSLKGNMTFSHAWGSAPGNVIVRNLCGIQPLEAGYSKAQIKPALGSLETVSVKAPNIKGYIYLDVDTTNPAYLTNMSVTLPANSTAKVYVPAANSGSEMVIVDGVTTTGVREGNYLVIDNVGSGTHTFQVPTTLKMEASVEEGTNYVGDTKQITVSVKDGEGNAVSTENAAVTYTSSNEKVATVDGEGVITFTGAGEATITANATFTNVEVNGAVIPSLALSADVKVSAVVAKKVDTILKSETISSTELQLTLVNVLENGKEEVIDPANVTFTSSDESIAIVDAAGKVTILNSGDVSFSAIEGDAGKVLFEDSFDTNANFPAASAANGVLTVGKGQNIFYAGGMDWNNYIVEVTGKAQANAWSLNFYQTSTGNFYLWQINESQGNILKPHVFVNGVATQLDTIYLNTTARSGAYKPGEYNTMRVEVVDGVIETYINDVLVYTVENDQLKGGSVGFRNGGSEISNIESMKVYKPGGAAILEMTLGKPTVELYVNGEATADASTEPMEFTVSAANASEMASTELHLEVKGAASEPEIVYPEGWMEVGKTVEENGGKYFIKVTMANLKGLTSTEAVEILKVIVTPTGEVGDVAVTVTEALVAAYEGEGETYVNVGLDNASATTKVEFNRYDVNRDGVVDQLDVTRTQRYYGLTVGDTYWYERADVNGDGIINITDMIAIMMNYTKK